MSPIYAIYQQHTENLERTEASWGDVKATSHNSSQHLKTHSACASLDASWTLKTQCPRHQTVDITLSLGPLLLWHCHLRKWRHHSQALDKSWEVTLAFPLTSHPKWALSAADASLRIPLETTPLFFFISATAWAQLPLSLSEAGLSVRINHSEVYDIMPILWLRSFRGSPLALGMAVQPLALACRVLCDVCSYLSELTAPRSFISEHDIYGLNRHSALLSNGLFVCCAFCLPYSFLGLCFSLSPSPVSSISPHNVLYFYLHIHLYILLLNVCLQWR